MWHACTGRHVEFGDVPVSEVDSGRSTLMSTTYFMDQLQMVHGSKKIEGEVGEFIKEVQFDLCACLSKEM